MLVNIYSFFYRIIKMTGKGIYYVIIHFNIRKPGKISLNIHLILLKKYQGSKFSKMGLINQSGVLLLIKIKFMSLNIQKKFYIFVKKKKIIQF